MAAALFKTLRFQVPLRIHERKQLRFDVTFKNTLKVMKSTERSRPSNGRVER
jgi:hypothetical protein